MGRVCGGLVFRRDRRFGLVIKAPKASLALLW
jgi:hypothetical protein